MVSIDYSQELLAVLKNSSPGMGKGNTALVLDPFLKELKESGDEVDLFYTQTSNNYFKRMMKS